MNVSAVHTGANVAAVRHAVASGLADAHRTYHPRTKLAAVDAARAVSLLQGVIDQRHPFIVVNRGLRSTEGLLEHGGRLRTAHDYGRERYAGGPEWYDKRLEAEVRLGLYGSGDLAGTTVYGSLQFAGPARSATTGRFELNAGLANYGGAGLVLDPAVLDRATFTATDTFAVRAGEVGTRRDLASVVLDYIDEVETYRTPGMPLTDRMRGMSDDALRNELRDFLHPSDLYMEAQIGGVSLGDIREIRLVRPTGLKNWADKRIDDVPALISRIEGLATARGIPVRRQ